MQIEHFDEKTVHGLVVRTKNEDEMHPKTSKIKDLWEDFDKKLMSKVESFPSVYGVYFDYESDSTGEFSVLSGSSKFSNTTNKNLQKVLLQSCDYKVFKCKGKLPDIIIETWTQVWEYFSGDREKERAYKTDFEAYVAPDEVHIYISVKDVSSD